MSDAFSFLFSLYGLLLGLAIAELAAGLSRAYDERKSRPIGFVAPMFAVLLLLDLITFWIAEFEYRDLAELRFLPVVGAALVAMLYYFAATQVFPRSREVESVDAHIMASRKVVVFCVIGSNVLSQAPIILAYMEIGFTQGFIFWLGINCTYYAILLAAGFLPRRWMVCTALGGGIAFLTVMSSLFA